VTTFALVHGAGHGGWCWELVVPELEARGHAAVAPDLPIEDEAAGAEAYAQVVVEALADVDGDVVVVGHSLGGVTLPLVGAARPVRRLVWLGAVVPMPGTTYLEYLATQSDAVVFAGAEEMNKGELADDPELSGGDGLTIPWTQARASFYHDVPEPLARSAWSRLRPQAMTPLTEPCPFTEWPEVPSTYIVMADDRTVGPAWSRRVATERLGADLVELGGSHSPFYSRPAELAGVLVGLA
jgi:pimeloyl-ACP methyl ester carboxylesterase